MSAFRLALLELGRFRGQPIRYAAIGAVAMIPLLYGALYLWSNWDPYGKMDQVPVAVVNEDAGASVDGERLDAGDQFVAQLKSTPELDWNFVSGDEAQRGMDAGDYYFTISVPSDFSEKLATLSTTDPERAQLGVQLDDANGYVAGIMAQTVETELQNQISTAVYITFAKTMFGDLNELNDGLNEAADGGAELADGADSMHVGSDELVSGLEELDSGSSQVAGGVDEVNNAVQANASPLINTLDTVQKGSQVGTDLGELLAGVDPGELERLCRADPGGAVCDELQEAVDKAQSQQDDLQQLNTAVQELTPGRISTQAEQMQELSDGAREVSDGTTEALDGARALSDAAQQLSQGSSELADRLSAAASGVPAMDPDENADAADILGTPVSIDESNRHSAGTYGRGMTPFFFAIALWVFGLVAYLVLRRVNPRALAGTTNAFSVALAGWLPAFGLGIVGALILYLVVDVCLGLNPDNVGGTLGLCVLAIAAFSAIAHFLRLALDAAGDVAILALLMLQLTSAGGLYPMETTPAFFQTIHPVMPMTYLVEGLRVTISGGNVAHLWRAVAVLAGFGIAALLASTLVVMRQRRWTMARLRPGVSF